MRITIRIVITRKHNSSLRAQAWEENQISKGGEDYEERNDRSYRWGSC